MKKTDWTAYRLRYLNADGSPKFRIPPATLDLLMNDPAKFKSYCNGVGSQVGFWGKLTYHFIPNTIGFMNVTPMSDLHDVGYSIPVVFDSIQDALDYKAIIDIDYRENIITEAKRRGGFLENYRIDGAWLEYQAVHFIGEDSFLANKTIKNLTA